MILLILGSVVTFFAIHLANLKLAKTEEQKVEIGSAIFISLFSWYGLVGFNIYILVKGSNKVLKNTSLGKFFKGGFDDSII